MLRWLLTLASLALLPLETAWAQAAPADAAADKSYSVSYGLIFLCILLSLLLVLRPVGRAEEGKLKKQN